MAEIAADAGVPVEDVLREVADFRLALETDMLIAAAAADAEAPEIMGDVLDGERRELRDFHDRMLDRLADAAVTELAVDRERVHRAEVVRRRAAERTTRRLARLVAAAATLVGLVGSAAVVRTFAEPTEPVAQVHSLRMADQQMDDLSRAALSERTEAAVAAATELHQTLQTLIDEHGDDPQVAQQIVSLLTQDLALIKSQPELRGVLNQALSLARQLQRHAPPQVRATVAPLIEAATSSAPASQKPKASPSPSPSPSPTASQPSPSPSPTQPSSSSSSSSGNQGSSNKNGEDDDPLPGSPL